MSTFSKPENALKREEESTKFGQNQEALHNAITSERYRAWQNPVMVKHVELRMGRFVKDGLIQYRDVRSLEEALDSGDLEADNKRTDRELVTHKKNSKLEALYAVNVGSLEAVINHFMHLSTERPEQARNLGGEKGKYRTDRELVTPWFTFLWENDRTLLEVLRNNSKLEALYAEAFRSIEDIHGMMCMVKKTPKPSLMVVYYAKLVLAAFSVTLYSQKCGAAHAELEKERNLRMANLTGFNIDPKLKRGEALSRASLLSELAAKGVLSCANQEVKDLFNLLEHEFRPLDLATKIQPSLAKVAKVGGKLSSASSLPEVQLSEYVPSLAKLTTLRLLEQVSRVYQTMTIECLSKMIPFHDFSVVERISADAVKHGFVGMKVDHMKRVVCFGNLVIESGAIRCHLAVLAEIINKARSMMYPPAKKASKLGDLLASLPEIVDKEHKRLLARKSIIEKRREDKELRQVVCQEINVGSLEGAINHFMYLSTERAEKARNKAQASEEALDVGDLEADNRPEDLMLSSVSGEKGKDRSDRELVTPWFTFSWETYRTVLQVLRNNSKLEALHAVNRPILNAVPRVFNKVVFYGKTAKYNGGSSGGTSKKKESGQSAKKNVPERGESSNQNRKGGGKGGGGASDGPPQDETYECSYCSGCGTHHESHADVKDCRESHQDGLGKHCLFCEIPHRDRNKMNNHICKASVASVFKAREEYGFQFARTFFRP